ncbi:MAG: hypothetical protein ACK5LT_13320 [Lachnospirales bacterium]
MKLKDKRIQAYLTPYKYPEPVLVGSGISGSFDEQAVDIPFVTYYNNKFYILYTGYDGVGYQSALATSEDLVRYDGILYHFYCATPYKDGDATNALGEYRTIALATSRPI